MKQEPAPFERDLDSILGRNAPAPPSRRSISRRLLRTSPLWVGGSLALFAIVHGDLGPDARAPVAQNVAKNIRAAEPVEMPLEHMPPSAIGSGSANPVKAPVRRSAETSDARTAHASPRHPGPPHSGKSTERTADADPHIRAEPVRYETAQAMLAVPEPAAQMAGHKGDALAAPELMVVKERERVARMDAIDAVRSLRLR